MKFQKRQSKTAASDYEIVSLTRMKLYLMVSASDQDDVIQDLINAAEADIEEGLGFFVDTSSLIYQYYDAFDTYLPIYHRFPAATDFVVQYTADSGTTWTSVASTVWKLDLFNVPPKVLLKDDQEWPDLELAEDNLVRIGFKVDTSVSFYKGLKAAVMTLVAARYENREGSDMPKTVKMFIDKWRLPA